MIKVSRSELEDTPLTLEVPTLDRCVRCGVPIFKKKKEIRLRCNHCREYVNDEINGGESRPLEFYFRYNISCNKFNAKDAENG